MGPITASIVSHGHGSLLPAILTDLAACPEVSRVIVTHNVAEAPIEAGEPGWQTRVENATPKGFAANHNAAFRRAATPYFLVVNPDVRLVGNPFPALLACMENRDVALCAPAVVDPAGRLEDSARAFPSVTNLIRKRFGRYDGRLQYSCGDAPRPAPWVAGMFMLVRSSDYASIRGFDEGFFLYYEDVDLCARLWAAGRRVMLCPEVKIIHEARRASRHDVRHMKWHAASMLRYFIKHAQKLKIPAS